MKEKRHRLKPCPFCGHTNTKGILWVDGLNDDYGWVVVKCLNCYCQGPSAHTEKLAIKLWNKRAK